jgi:penicillin-binding protein 2
MREAIQKSCNVYFYRLAADLGYRLLWTRARQLGFGLPSGLELSVLEPKEEEVIATGSGAWLERGANSLTHPRKAASPLAPLHFAIGQGYVTASPLQMARFYGWLATGKLATPRLVLEGAGGAPALPETERFLLSSASRVKLMDALRSVVEEQGGTAWDPETSLALHRVSGKTGTAQVGGGENHAWFAGYFPWDKPRYAFAVFCENVDLHGGELATLVLDRFLKSPEVAFLLQEDSP